MTFFQLVKYRWSLKNTIPLFGGWLRRRAARALASDGGNIALNILTEALIDNVDSRVRDIAYERLKQVDATKRINDICNLWLERRIPVLEQLINEQKWVASAPLQLNVKTALLQGRTDVFKSIGIKHIYPLLQSLDDKNLTISNTANDILRTLGRQDTKNELCRIAINDSNQTALEIAVECGYLPSDAAQRAAFLFLTEQWEQYESLDFDQRLLRTVFESAEPKLRQSITDKLRKTGRTDFLTVVVGGDYRSHAVEMSDSEAEMMVQMLANSQEWPKLWPLVFELSVCWGIQIMQHLIRANWVPSDELDQQTYHQLAEIVPDKIILSLDQITHALPPALQRATANVSGRINDLAFSPNKPVIAIGSGNRKVALWDFQKAEQYALINGFEHSIGNVNFTGRGDLVCSERTNGSDQCSVYTWADGKLLKLGTHRGSLTALEPVGDSMLLTTGRDHYGRVWNIPERKMVAERRFRDWPRTACVSTNAGRAALVVKGGFVVSLPDLKDLSISTWASSSVSSCAAFSTANNELVAGYLSGQVLYCRLPEYNKTHKPEQTQPSNGIDILADMREKLVDYEYYSTNGKRVYPQKLCAHSAPVWSSNTIQIFSNHLS